MKLPIIFLFTTSLAIAGKCPLMVQDDTDADEVSTVFEKKIEFCCGSCVKTFEANTAYYIKAIPDLAAKFTEEQKQSLKLSDVKLLEQRYCPVYPDRIVNPNSPTVEYMGKTIYLWSSSAVRRWNRSPDLYYDEAVARGHLK